MAMPPPPPNCLLVLGRDEEGKFSSRSYPCGHISLQEAPLKRQCIGAETPWGEPPPQPGPEGKRGALLFSPPSPFPANTQMSF